MASTDPKTATQGQWEDLASRVQSKAEIGTVLSTPSSTVFVQTANIADGAITTDKITDTAVTASKVDFTTFSTNTDFVKTGTATVEYQADNSGGGFVAVPFPTAFNHDPIVLAQDVLTNGRVSSLTVSGISTSGFKLLARTAGTSAGSTTVNWIAFDPQALPIKAA